VSDIYRPPASDVARPEVLRTGGSVERALAGDFEFEPLEVLQEAWRLTDGVKLIFLVGMVAAVVATLAVQFLVMRVMPTPSGLGGLIVTGLLTGTLQLLVVGPIYAGIFVVAAWHSAGRTVAMSDLFAHFDKTARIFGVMMLGSLLSYVGFALLILPGIYLTVAYIMALPLVAEKNMPVWQALETSRKVVTKCWWRMFFVGVLIVLILIVSSLPIGIPLIWTVPMGFLSIGVIYRNLFGVQPAGS
jgi:uncharacterized membrane protein